MAKAKTIEVKGTTISIIQKEKRDYISLTDMANARTGDARAADVIKNWIRNRSTLEFLGTWEQIHNPDFKVVEFDHFKTQAGLPSFVLSPSQWVEKTSAIGLFSKAGRYGGTYAHTDIAFEFGSAINPVFKLYLIKEYQRLKEEEQERNSLEWNVSRTLAKVNYRIHTDAIKEHLLPPKLQKQQIAYVYASEADLLNMALFGKTAAEWRKENPDAEGNIRDQATLEQLVVLANLESMNALFIQQGMDAPERLKILNQQAIQQMKSLLDHAGIKKLKE